MSTGFFKRLPWRVWLAHLLRDAKYAVECGDTAFSAPFRLLLLRAVAIGRRREALKDTTLKDTTRSNTLAIWIEGSIASWPRFPSASRDVSCASEWPLTGRTCSCS
jgi:hypothetical protein